MSGGPPANEGDPNINICPSGNQIGHSLSIVHLSSSPTLLQAWQAPGTACHGHDWDFGSSPALFGSRAPPPDLGAYNKNGRYYALAATRRAARPEVDRHDRRARRLAQFVSRQP